MKFFKTNTSKTAPRFEISYDKFVEVTGRDFPFEQINDGRLVQYGICPSCSNPIQLIGVMNEIKTSPYGRHTGKDITGLPPWNYRKYVFCPFAKNGRISPKDDERLQEDDADVIELYNLMKQQFDRIVYIVENKLGIRCSTNFWRAALNQYIKSRAFRYPWLTEANLPYIFAYFGVHKQNLLGQRFLVGTKLYNTLEKFHGVKFMESDTPYQQLTKYGNINLQLYFRFTDHKHIVSDGQTLNEVMKFCVDDRKTGKTIYTEQVKFDETYFMNLVNKKSNSDKRNLKHLEIAEDCMPPLLLNS